MAFLFAIPGFGPALATGLGLGLGLNKGEAETVNDVTNITKTLMNVDNHIKQNIEENCISQNTQKNVINIINSKVRNATLAQKNQLQTLCALQSSFQNNVNSDVQNKIAAAIAETAKSKGGDIFGGKAASKNIAKVINESSTFIDNSQVLDVIKTCVLKIY